MSTAGRYSAWKLFDRQGDEPFQSEENAPNDVFADHLNVRRPHAVWPVVRPWISCCRQVVDEGVDPDIDGMIRIAWNPDAPVQSFRRSRNRQIIQIARVWIFELCE